MSYKNNEKELINDRIVPKKHYFQHESDHLLRMFFIFLHSKFNL